MQSGKGYYLKEAREVGVGLEGLKPGVPHGPMPFGNDIIMRDWCVLQRSL